MAKITADWTEAVTLHSSSSVAAGVSVTDDIDLDNLGAIAVMIQIEIIFGGTPDANVLVEILGSVDSGVQDDTEVLHSFTIEDTASATKRQSIVVHDVAYLAVRVTNNDTTDSVTYDGLYAWLQRDSA